MLSRKVVHRRAGVRLKCARAHEQESEGNSVCTASMQLSRCRAGVGALTTLAVLACGKGLSRELPWARPHSICLGYGHEHGDYMLQRPSRDPGQQLKMFGEGDQWQHDERLWLRPVSGESILWGKQRRRAQPMRAGRMQCTEGSDSWAPSRGLLPREKAVSMTQL